MVENESANQNMLGGQDPREAELARQRKAQGSYEVWSKLYDKLEKRNALSVESLLASGQLLLAAKNVLEAKRKLWKQEQAVKLAAVAYAVEHKEILADNYWQTEHRAFEAYLAAEKIYNVILEIEKESENAQT